MTVAPMTMPLPQGVNCVLKSKFSSQGYNWTQQNKVRMCGSSRYIPSSTVASEHQNSTKESHGIQCDVTLTILTVKHIQ